MVVKEVWIVRHGFREDWVNENPKLPTNLKNDPPLSEFGREQAQELANYLQDKNIQGVYSSPFYRVLETVYPLVEKCDIPLQVEYSVAEWYGLSHDRYLPCASLVELNQHFPKLNVDYESSIALPAGTETAHECHIRVKKGMDILIDRLDKENIDTILISGHAASSICAIRGLLNNAQYPVRCGTCSLTHLIRQQDGSWKIVKNGDSSHLSQGEQRHWTFSGDVPDYEINKKI